MHCVLIAYLIACWQVDMQLAAQLSPRTRSKVATIFSQHEILEPLLPPLDLYPSVPEGGGGAGRGWGDRGRGDGDGSRDGAAAPLGHAEH